MTILMKTIPEQQIQLLSIEIYCFWYYITTGISIRDYYYLAILRHSSAHILHAWAHSLQCSMSLYFSHSSAHSSQISAQIAQIFFECSLSRDINCDAVIHMFVQSRLSCIHLVIELTSCSRRSEVAQNSHDSKQSLQASMQVWYFWFWSTFLTLVLTIQHGT